MSRVETCVSQRNDLRDKPWFEAEVFALVAVELDTPHRSLSDGSRYDGSL